jgi:hypothetical protein
VAVSASLSSGVAGLLQARLKAPTPLDPGDPEEHEILVAWYRVFVPLLVNTREDKTLTITITRTERRPGNCVHSSFSRTTERQMTNATGHSLAARFLATSDPTSHRQ